MRCVECCACVFKIRAGGRLKEEAANVMDSNALVTDTSAWPLVITRMYGTEQTAANLQGLFRQWEDCFARGVHGLLIDASHGRMGHDAKQRAQIGNWMSANLDNMRRCHVCSVIVTQSSLTMGIITAVMWLVRPPRYHGVVNSVQVAVDICLAKLVEAGVSVDVQRVHALALRSCADADEARTSRELSS